jgi:thiamine kinase-like enzyme
MNKHFKSFILDKTGATDISSLETIQDLWSGYGKIIRITLENYSKKSIVVKHVQLPNNKYHPRGWNSDLGHQRKIKSYEVEKAWYQHHSNRSKARLPKCVAMTSEKEEVLIILEDLNEAGYHLRKRSLNWEEITRCLKWLARFHASYLGEEPDRIWEVGTYWHLETRPQELEALTDLSLKEAASQIDQKLNNCRYKTFVHGDAKLANFCFAENDEVAALDFQYVGGGCGMKDVAYFIGSCLSENECERLESEILNSYFQFLQNELEEPNHDLELEWRSLYRVAWADFHRFLKGWSPGHWKINSYSERITKEVINKL